MNRWCWVLSIRSIKFRIDNMIHKMMRCASYFQDYLGIKLPSSGTN